MPKRLRRKEPSPFLTAWAEPAPEYIPSRPEGSIAKAALGDRLGHARGGRWTLPVLRLDRRSAQGLRRRTTFERLSAALGGANARRSAAATHWRPVAARCRGNRRRRRRGRR